MPLYKRRSSASSLTGFPSFGVNPESACCGQFIFSNSESQTGANQFLYMVCENNTEGFDFTGYANGTGYLYLNLKNQYSTQGWFIKNSIVAIGQHADGSQCEYLNAELNSFVFSEGNSNFDVINSNCTFLIKSQNDFNIQVLPTNDGIKYKYMDSSHTKMKWVSKIEAIQNINKEKAQFNLNAALAQLTAGSMPDNSSFALSSNNSINFDGGIDGEDANVDNVDGGSV